MCLKKGPWSSAVLYPGRGLFYVGMPVIDPMSSDTDFALMPGCRFTPLGSLKGIEKPPGVVELLLLGALFCL